MIFKNSKLWGQHKSDRRSKRQEKQKLSLFSEQKFNLERFHFLFIIMTSIEIIFKFQIILRCTY